MPEEYLQKAGERTFIYFSTCSVYDPQEQASVYVKHKLQVEQLIRSRARHYRIFRVSNLAGASSNPANFRVADIVTTIEEYLGIRSNFVENEKGACFDIDISLVRPVLEQPGLSFDATYLQQILSTYYR